MPDDGSQVGGQPAGGNEGAAGAGAAGASNESPNIGWKTEIPTSLREHEAFAPYKTKDELWNGHIEVVTKAKELEGKLAGSIPKLTETSTDEERAAYYAALGVPETPDKYEFERPALPEGVQYNEAMENWFRAAAHKAGVSQDTAKLLYKDYTNFSMEFLKQQQIDQAAQRESALKDGMMTLEADWGPRFQDNLKIVKEVQEAIGLADEGMKEVLKINNLDNDPRIIRWMLNLAPHYTGDNAPGRSGGGSNKVDGGVFDYPSMKNLPGG